jgi:hypothetical protein
VENINFAVKTKQLRYTVIDHSIDRFFLLQNWQINYYIIDIKVVFPAPLGPSKDRSIGK